MCSGYCVSCIILKISSVSNGYVLFLLLLLKCYIFSQLFAWLLTLFCFCLFYRFFSSLQSLGLFILLSFCKTFSTILNKSSGGKYSYPVPNFNENASSISSLSIYCKVLVDSVYQVEEFSVITSLLRVCPLPSSFQ